MAFVAVGSGILPFNTETRLAGGTVAVGSGGFVRDLAADAASVVAVGEARLYAQFTRSGPKGGTLTSEVDRLAAIEASEVSIVGGLAIVSENDQAPPPGPDEAARGLLEIGRTHPDLVVLDYTLPDFNAVQVVERLLDPSRRLTAEVMVMTGGMPMEADIRMCRG